MNKQFESLAEDSKLSQQDASNINELRSLAQLLGYKKTTWNNSWIFELENDVLYFWGLLADAKMTHKPQPLMTLADAYRLHLCADSRDNIYALLGISTLPPGALVVDYSCTIQSLYNDVRSLVQDEFTGHNEDCLKRALCMASLYDTMGA